VTIPPIAQMPRLVFKSLAMPDYLSLGSMGRPSSTDR
jgi:hypothetical protein